MAVKALLHYALEVPDQGAGEKFYSNFGLIDAPGRDGAVRLRPAPLQRESVLLYGGPRKRLHHLAFGAPGDEYAATREAVRRAGIREVDSPRGAPEGGFWVRDPDSNLVNIRDEARVVPPPDPPLALNSPGRIAREIRRGCPDAGFGAKPRRLGHVLLFTGGLDRQLDFYTRVLGMKLTDRSRQVIVFLRCTTDHHNLAFLVSKGPGFHHGSFEVGNVDEIAMGAAKMQEAGWQPGWGLGRHVIGSNFFYYIRDPWGSFAEYFHDLDYIPEHCAWEPRDFPEAEALYRWGPPVPEDFGRNRELEWRPLRAARAEPARRRRGSLPPGRHRRPRRDRARVQGRGRRGAPGGERRLERALRRAPPRQRDRDLQRLRGVAPRRRPTRGLRLERRDGERVRARHAVPRPRGGPLRRGGGLDAAHARDARAAGRSLRREQGVGRGARASLRRRP